MSIDEIKKLDIKDRIILMNDIWATLEYENPTIESPTWHNEVLEARMEKIKKNTAKYISLEELKSR
ncbi:addiction module protein [Arcobacter sp. FWKO B]|uniref:addiction module protein n=1 Tax=Arcobacter sp. FWKO B TaxID=2593672 RepID=UPI0018A49DF0|nr:addiction module protein [Arcobacter sp. FWKO B]QOG12096.1 addiction module protein [Arcobacter sp. FWKO B]